MTDVRRKRIPLLGSTVGNTTLAKGFGSNMELIEVYTCLQKNKVAWKGCLQCEVQRNRQEMSQRKCCGT